MSIPAERLRHLADTKRGIDDPQDIGYYESCALAEECLALRTYVKQVEQWYERGEEIMNKEAEWSYRFRLGGWWADRPWRKRLPVSAPEERK